MDFYTFDRRILLTSLFALALSAQPSFARTDEGTEGSGSSGKQLRVGAGGSGSSGAPHGPPEDRHSDEDGHEDDHADSHEDGHEDGHGEDDAASDEHESDHVSGEKGKGPRYRGGREGSVVGVSHARSLEDRVLRKEPY